MAGTSKLDLKLCITGCLLLFLCSVSSELLEGREVTIYRRFVNWTTAYKECARVGKQLMFIRTEEENRRVLELAKKEYSFWLGATYGGFKEWIWVSNGKRLPKRWWQKEGNYYMFRETCLEMHFFEGWKYISCSEFRYFLCQETDQAIAKRQLNETKQLATACGTEVARLWDMKFK